MNTEKKFYIDCKHVKMCYPRNVSERVDNLGVLEQYKDQKYTLKEINEIIADLIIKSPYISNSMYLKISVSSNLGYHHILNIRNYEYDKQKQVENPEIGYLYS